MAETGRVLHRNRTRPRRAAFAGLAAAVVLGGAGARAAEPRPIGDAIVLGEPRCIHREALSRRLGTWLGADVLDARLSISIDEAPGTVRFVLRRDDAVVGVRTLAVGSDTCDDVTAAAALAIASALEVAARGDGPESTEPAPASLAPGEVDASASDPALDPEAPPATPPASPPSPSPSPEARGRDDATPTLPDPGTPASRRGVLAVTVESAALIGVLPRPAFAVAPGASLGVGHRVEVRLSAVGALPVTAELEPAGTAEVGLFAGRLDLCGGGHVLGGSAWIRGCGGLSAGGMAAEGIEVESPSSAVGAWLAAAVRAEVHWMPAAAPLGIAISLDGFAPLVRPRLQVQDAGGAVTATGDLPLLGAAAAIGPCVVF